MARTQYGVFVKDGFGRRVAYSPAEAVRYAYDGWTKVADQVQSLAAATKAATAADAAETAEQPAKSKTGSK